MTGVGRGGTPLLVLDVTPAYTIAFTGPSPQMHAPLTAGVYNW